VYFSKVCYPNSTCFADPTESVATRLASLLLPHVVITDYSKI